MMTWRLLPYTPLFSLYRWDLRLLSQNSASPYFTPSHQGACRCDIDALIHYPLSESGKKDMQNNNPQGDNVLWTYNFPFYNCFPVYASNRHILL